MNKFATKYSVIDPFNFTKSVVSNVDWYHDTEDGFHMGWWINLQKVQMVIEKFMSVSVVEEMEEVEDIENALAAFRCKSFMTRVLEFASCSRCKTLRILVSQV